MEETISWRRWVPPLFPVPPALAFPRSRDTIVTLPICLLLETLLIEIRFDALWHGSDQFRHNDSRCDRSQIARPVCNTTNRNSVF